LTLPEPIRAGIGAQNERNSAIADKPRDVFRGQSTESRSPNMIPFHMLGLVSN